MKAALSIRACAVCSLLVAMALRVGAEQTTPVLAMLRFAPGRNVEQESCDQLGDLLFAELAQKPGLALVERMQLDVLLAELKLSVSGLVSPAQAVTVGKRVGADLVLIGRIYSVGARRSVLVKVVSCATSQVIGIHVPNVGAGDLTAMAEKLAAELVQGLADRRGELLPIPASFGERLADVLPPDTSRPTLRFRIRFDGENLEEDPGLVDEAETVARRCLLQARFIVADASGTADRTLEGKVTMQALSSIRQRTSVRCHLVVQLLDPTGRELHRWEGTTLIVGENTASARSAGIVKLVENVMFDAIMWLAADAQGKGSAKP